jgi:hypothetical protein
MLVSVATEVYHEQDRKVFLEMAKVWMELALKEKSAFRTDTTRTKHHRSTGPDQFSG